MDFIKMVTITLYARQQKRHRCIEQSYGLCGRGREKEGEQEKREIEGRERSYSILKKAPNVSSLPGKFFSSNIVHKYT